MHSYIGSKKTLAGSGLLLIDMQKNLSTSLLAIDQQKQGKKLWEGVKDRSKGFIATDYWGPYKKFVPKNKHIQSKAHTYTVEGYNSLFRHFLARMRRKSKCYSKSIEMLEYSVKLLILKRNGMLDILN